MIKRQQASLLLFSIGSVVLFTLLVLRLGHVQLIQGASYLGQADDNRFFEVALAAPRGLILDRYGEPLTWNVQQYFAVDDPTALFTSTHAISRQDALQRIATQGASAVSSKLQRFYRYPSSLAHVVGYVGEVTAEDLQREQRFRPGMVVGKAGLELMFEEQLRGQPGGRTYEVNALGKKQRPVATREPVEGSSVETTLDPFLTELAMRRLGDVKGAVIVADSDTGSILAMTSLPVFDPNILSQPQAEKAKEAERKQRIQEMFQDSRNLFFNRGVAGAYPPGSVFKLVTAVAGLEHQKLDAQTEVVDEGVLKVGEFQFGNWYFRQYGRVEGSVRLRRAISRSNDIYFYKAAEWVGPNLLAQVAREFGYGEKTGIQLPSEARGIVPDPEWKMKTRGEPWFLGNTYHYGIGQGDVLTTPIQVAQMTQAIAARGKKCPLSLLKQESRDCQELGITGNSLDEVIGGMVDACSPGGTAYPFFPYNAARIADAEDVGSLIAGGAVACKTGTAEFGGANEQGHRKTHGWFTAFLQLPDEVTSKASDTAAETFSSPEFNQVTLLSDEELHRLWRLRTDRDGFPQHISITVLIESDEEVEFREGSRDAAPVAQQIVEWMTRTP